MPYAAPPLVSVIIPAYNAAWCLERAIRSVNEQECTDLEIIVVNDGSTDETEQLLAGMKDERLQVITQPNRGLSAARNTGILSASGRYLAFLDADDWWLPGKLEAQLDILEKHPGIGFCSVATQVVDPRGELLRVWTCPHWEGSFLLAIFEELAAVAGSGSGVMARRELFDQAGLFDETLDSLEDIDMWMRLAAISDYTCLEEPLAAILKHPESMSHNLPVMRRAAIRVLHKNRSLLPPAYRGRFWRNTLAGIYADYAKGFWRAGRRSAALADTLHALALAPLQRGRLCLGLLRDMALGKPL